MLRFLKLVGVIGTLAITASFGAGWWYATATPSSTHLALPGALLDARSTEGQSLLESTPFRIDHDLLSKHFVTQSRRGYCGVASSTIVLNALRPSTPPLSQEAFFTAKANAVRGSLNVTFGGMTLAQLADLLRAHELSVSVVHASESNLQAFRSTARASLVDPSDFLLVNYDRVTLHQRGGGHISPVVAYHAGTDRLLVLDVASYNYPPTWVPATDLWNSMNTTDTSSGRTRGFLLVRNVDAQQEAPAELAATRPRG